MPRSPPTVYEQSLPDRHETGPDGQPRLLPRQTLHHVYLRDVATDHYTQLGIAATKAVARHYRRWRSSVATCPPSCLPMAIFATPSCRIRSFPPRRPRFRRHPAAPSSLSCTRGACPTCTRPAMTVSPSGCHRARSTTYGFPTRYQSARISLHDRNGSNGPCHCGRCRELPPARRPAQHRTAVPGHMDGFPFHISARQACARHMLNASAWFP